MPLTRRCDFVSLIAMPRSHTEETEDIILPFVSHFFDAKVKNRRTYATISDRSGFAGQYVRMIGRARRLPRLETVLKLCAAAGVPRKKIEELLNKFLDTLSWDN
jgi:hypothetical protein